MRHATREFPPLDEEEATTAQISMRFKPPRVQPRRAHVLVLKKGDGAAPRTELQGDVMVLGRSLDSDVPVDSDEVSRQHVRFTRVDDEYQVEDLGSRNGLYLNGLRVHLAVLREGDELHIGNVVFEYQEGT